MYVDPDSDLFPTLSFILAKTSPILSRSSSTATRQPGALPLFSTDFQVMYQGVLKDEERVRLKALTKAQATATSPPLNTPSAPVQQPAAVIDEDCVTCAVSPPPELVEGQSKEQRAVERAERMAEYEAQKGLANKLGSEQGVKSARMV